MYLKKNPKNVLGQVIRGLYWEGCGIKINRKFWNGWNKVQNTFQGKQN